MEIYRISKHCILLRALCVFVYMGDLHTQQEVFQITHTSPTWRTQSLPDVAQ